MEQLRERSKRALTLFLAIVMILTSLPLDVLAKVNYEKLADDKEKFVNTLTPVKPAKPENGKTAEDLIKNPAQPAIYTLRTDFKVQRGEKYQVDYQPYIASVGEAASDAEKAKVNKTMPMPDIAGYKKPQENFTIDHNTIVNKAKAGTKSEDKTNGDRYNANKEFNYDAISNKIQIKHVFQKLDDFNKYTNPDGSVGDDTALITTQNGNTGSTVQASPLSETDPRRKGFIPEAEYINMQVPQNAKDFILEYRYNRAHYDVVFDTQGGTALPTRTLYYEQVIPKIADADIPTKVGGVFQGWKPSVDLKTKDGKTYKANEIIKVGTDAIKNLDAKLEMPASNVTFTAVWKDKEKADYAIQFWAEKADHADGASLADKYDYIGTRVYKDQATGSRPDLDNEPVDKIVFPDLDQARLQKIWNGEKFYGDKYLLLNKFYVYNKDLTHDQNKDPENVNLVKSVDSTGRTVYNIYYDRQVYDLYFTKSNALSAENTFYPEIYVPDGNGGAKLAGGPGNPYHYQARFNQLMLGWPNDAMQTKGFDEGKQSYGWGPNYGYPQWPLHLDTPPYRLNADEFLDMPNYDNWGGYVSQIDKGDGSTIDVNNNPRYKDAPYKALSFGIKQDKGSMPHHMDFWMDGFKDGETIIRYDLYRFKADTNSLDYGHKYSRVQGFTPKGSTIEEGSEEHGRITEDDIDTLNEERGEITPYPNKNYTDTFGFNNALGQMHFRSAFFNNADEFGDPLKGVTPFTENGYIRFKYTRNKYPLRFNFDPSVTKDDSEFGPTNSLDTFYEFPLKALNPESDTEESYKTGNPKNILDNPENLQTLGLTDLVFNDANDNNKLKVKRPDNLSNQMVFKGWALDPAGTKLIWENPGEKMPNHPVNLYAKWGEPDYQWKVTFDPNGGALSSIDEAKVTQKRKTIQVGDKGQEETKTFAQKEKNEGDKQVFTVIQRQKLKEPAKPTKKGYDFMGWEVIRYKKDATTGDYTNDIDDSYRKTYKVPELYSFGNDVVSPIYLKAIWVPNDRVDVDVVHHIMSLDLSTETKKITETLRSKRTGYLVATGGDKQNEEYILASHKELEEKLPDELKTLYKEYNDRVKANNTYFQTFKVEPEKIPDPNDSSKMIDNPKAKDNVFHFFYRPFRTRDYKVNYIDERYKAKVEEFFKGLKLEDINKLMEGEEYKNADDKGKEAILLEANEGNKEKFEAKRKAFEELIKKYQIIDPEAVSNGNRHYDARNYRKIPGWVLAENEKPQQQLFFDVNEKTNEFLGINGTGADQVFFYYKDVRVIEVPGDKEPPKGYVRVTFKADKGGSFTDKDGNSKTELYYDVIKGLKSDLLPEPKELEEGKTKEEGKYYITPETGKKFIKWDEKPLLNKNTIVDNDTKDFYVFTAKFEWSGLSASGLVRTEAFKVSSGKWTNDFAPKIEDLKKQLVWMEKGAEKPLPTGATIKFFDEAGNELTKDEQVYDLVKELNKADKDELVRTVNIKAKVTFTDGKDPQELTIPITVYKNVYEALNKAGDKPLFLKEAEGKEAKDGGLKDVTGDYVMVTIRASKDFNAKDDKVYWVNKNAWVEIPEVKTEGSSTFVNWTADKDGQNENGIFDFGKRHKFNENTVISPSDATDVVEQTDPNKKPDVPSSYVKVIVDKTVNAELGTGEKQTQTFWVNPSKEVTIPVANPTGKTVAADPAKVGAVGYTMNFSKWKSEETTPRTWEDKIVGKFEKETTILAKYSVKFETIKDQIVDKNTVHTPQGKTPTADEIKAKITPPEGKTISKVTIVENPDVTNPGKSIAKVIVEYTDGSSVGTNDKPLEVPVEVHKNIIPEAPGGEKPKDALDNYVKVILKAGEGGKFEDTLTNQFVYYVSPEVEVDMTGEADKISKTPDTGYIVNGGEWKNKDNKALKGTFTDPETVFEYNFKKSTDIVEKLDENTKKPEGYVEVIFKADANGKLEGDKVEKIYYVNPKAGIKLVELADGQTAGEKELAVPKTVADTNYAFDKWFENIDQTNPIKSDRVHVAQFKLNKVTLTYDAGGAEGTVPKSVTVDHGTKVELSAPIKLNKAYASFNGWKIGQKIYKPGEEITLTENCTAIAKWINDEEIISYDPSNPITKPEGYVRVSFAADDGLKLTEQKAYYVKKDAGITLAQLTKPTYDVKTGYVFKEWDKADKDTIITDVLVTAKSTKLETVIPEKTGETPNIKPDGYKEVTFVIKTDDAAKGSIDGVAKFYVNPKEFVTINPPATKANTGYEFGAWDKDSTRPTVYDKDTTITGSFNGLKNVIPKTKDDDSEKPKGYVKVTFEIEKLDGKEAGKIVDGETITYFVKPNTDVTIPQPKTLANTGYKFKEWNPDTSQNAQYSEDTTVKGNFTKLDDIIPATKDNGKENTKPDGYVTVTFDKGEHGKDITGKTVYYVNPKADPVKTLAEIKKPTVKAEVGYKFNTWNFADTKEITSDITVIAQYTPTDDVIPKDKPTGGENDKPEGYITVTFDKGANGELEGNTTFYINPNKAVVLEDKAPTIKPKTGYTSAGWDTTINKAIQYKDGDKITALYNDPGNISTTEVAGYVKVEFKPGTSGTLDGTTEYWIKPGVEVNITAPSVKPNIGYKFDKWDKDLTVTLNGGAPTYEITAGYTPLDDIIPQKNTDDSDRPEGYYTVTFKAVNGTTSGQTVFYVNGKKEINLTNTANGISKKANIGYTDEGVNWSPAITNKKYTDDVEYTFTFKTLADVIEKTDENTKKPDGYVTVKFTPTANAQDQTEKVYYVNPKANVTIPVADPVGKEVTDLSGTKYTFNFRLWTVTRGTVATWNKDTPVSGQFIQDTDITAKYNVEYKELIKSTVPKDNVVTGKGDKPNPEDLIKNKFDKDNPNNPNNLPDGTKITYEEEPKVDEVGNVTAKVKVEYPSGAVTIVEVPLTVVDHVVPQIGGEDGQKPLVPEKYVKVTVDTTDKATPNTKYVKVFWVKPDVKVTIPGILAPTGKPETDANGVKNTNNFIKWISDDNNKEYTDKITDAFTNKETKITANYEFNKNTPEVKKDNPWFPLNSKPEAKDFIENIYNDNDPYNKNNLPPGTKLEFVQGKEPYTGEVGQYSTTIKVTYPNGEVKTVDVPYKVTGDVVEQEYGKDKPTVPGNYVLVTVNTTDKANDYTKFSRKFWVKPNTDVTIPVVNPIGKYVPKDQDKPDFTYKFIGWESEDKSKSWNDTITGQFIKDTTIIATYIEDQAELADIYYTTESLREVNNYLPTEDQLEALVKNKVQDQYALVEFLTDPQDFIENAFEKLSENKVNEIKRTETISAKVTVKDGTVSIVEIPIVVYKNIYEGLTNGTKPQYVAQAEDDLKKSNPGRDDNVYVRVTLIPTAKAKNQQRKTYYVRKNASVIIPEIIAEGRDAYQFIYWEAETPGKGQDNPNYSWATRSMAMFRSAEPINKDDLVNNGKKIDKVDGNTRMSFNQDTDIVAHYNEPQPKPEDPSKPEPWTPGYIGGGNIYIGKPSVNPTAKAKEPVAENEYRKEVRYMQGFNGNFRPEDGLTRAEAAQILANALVEDGFKYTENFKIPYKDVKEEWYTRAIRIVTEAKVFAGYDDGLFRPEKKITRNEWIATLKRFQELNDVVGDHMKLGNKHWAKSEIEAAFNEGWLSIYTDGLANFKGDEFIPREEVAAVSNRAFNRVLDKDYIENNINNLITYKDVDKSRWSYYDILCASNTFIFQGGYYRAHWIKQDNDLFNVNTNGIDIFKSEFQRNPR